MYKFSLVILLFLYSQISFGINDISEKNDARKTIEPPLLKKGDTILILAPAGKIKNKDAIISGIELAEEWGLVVVLGEHLLDQNNSFAGKDQERLNDFQKGLDNPTIKMIWAARGGYGTVRIIDDLDFSAFIKHPKWIVGYSDVTVLHNKLNTLGFQSIHAQMPSTLNLHDPIQEASIESLYKVLFGKKLKYELATNKHNRTGKSKGIITGGNLSILYSMLGSNTSLETNNKIIFIEDVGEYLYHLDRMLISLKRAGYFKNAKGLIVGDFSLKTNESNPFGKSLEEIILEAVEGTDFPILFDFPAGHLDDNRALILGAMVELKVTDTSAKVNFN